MKVAAYQAPLLPSGSMSVVDLLQERVRECEKAGISVLCCPEAVLGGLADYSECPAALGIRSDGDQLATLLARLASNTVTSIVGFTEICPDGELYNTAAVFQCNQVVGIYRKMHPAIRYSVYSAGSEIPVFRAGPLTFGIVICNDSNFPALGRAIARHGAKALFVPTNNGMPNHRANPDLNDAATAADIKLAVQNRVWVIRADVCGQNGTLTSYGSSEIVDPDGEIVCQSRHSGSDMLIAEIAE